MDAGNQERKKVLEHLRHPPTPSLSLHPHNSLLILPTAASEPTPAPAAQPVAAAAKPAATAATFASTGPQIPVVVAASSITPTPSPKIGKKKKGKR
ncbi:hypothetical protein BC938DRAFT_484207 [Jimgerdemannia flammicorona]|uniref:Uncharacterized protein n=1 Tax=Jimgerdemannia flammicorona TaxID=994334 RepID=A0A433QVA7_9FUNG|nr:hypothetical protein BC938DRAFT_484207 [Jimgerdemannia flammicorona]